MSSREITPFQPVLPGEVPWTDAEYAFYDDSPEHLFPDNQDSNFGLFRKLFTDVIQILIEQQNLLYNERFIDTSTQFLDEYEKMVGLPPNPPSKSIQQRRYEVSLRLIRGPFTRPRRNEIIERYISATFGPPAELTVAGIPLTAPGYPLYAESGELSQVYNVIENIPGFSYEVRILDSLAPDMVGLNRELKRITPAGISFTVNLVPNP